MRRALVDARDSLESVLENCAEPERSGVRLCIEVLQYEIDNDGAAHPILRGDVPDERGF